MKKQLAKIIGIARHRLLTDGDGVTTLIAFPGCQLRCRSCLNQMNPDIYHSYTGQSNDLVLDNLQLIAEAGRQHDCIIRIPLILDYNTDTDRDASRKALEALGFTRFNLFTYHIRKQ